MEYLRLEIRKDFHILIGNKLAQAKGIFVEKIVERFDKKGKKLKKAKVVVYQKEPDGAAINDLFDLVVGKPKQITDPGIDHPTTVIINIISEEMSKAEARIKKKGL